MSVKAKNVLVGLSGGVDSSVAAALLIRQGFRVTGVTMKTWVEGEVGDGSRHGCYGPGREKDIEQASNIAGILGIPFHVIDLSQEFKTRVLDYFCNEYLVGRTPNPCVRCNRFLKFGALLEGVRKLGLEFDYLATGHYARIEWDECSRRYLLKRGKDSKKDQSYFLYGLSQEQLAHAIFPLGTILKDEVRKISRELGLEMEGRRESQDFASGGYASLFAHQPGPGPVVDMQGRVLGTHRGIVHYTLGQHRGLGLTTPEPLYVVDIRADSNEIVVGRKEGLLRSEQVVDELNWIAVSMIGGRREVKAQIRSTHSGYDASISPMEGGRVEVIYKKPQPGAARGQSIVFYEGDIVIGGGIVL